MPTFFARVMNLCLSLLFIVVVASPCPAQSGAPAQTPPQAPAHPEMLVSAQWLSEHSSEPGIVILHVAKDKADYDRGHIPGAHFLQISKFLDEHVGAMVELPSTEQLKEAFEEAGVSDDSRVIIYTTAWFPLAARAYYTLDFLGHENMALLDGGYEQWTLEKRPVSTETQAFSKGSFTPRVRPGVRAMLDEARAAAESAAAHVALVDARPQKRYRDGHLTGAANIYWLDTLISKESPVFRPVEELRRIYESAGIPPGRKVITYCEVGYQASHGYFLAKYLGYHAAMYDGSMYEWQEMQSLPVVKGDAKR
jgi:thiosulfate/3-mercaptopyruvate sulfurtransferase